MDTSIRKPASGTVFFILFTAFLNLAGVGILNPIVPFIVGKYVARADGAFVVSLLFTSYSLCQFLAVPSLGALSDRFGRRPVLLISLLGSAAGYLIFGLGGALWVLFLGRIIDGLTGGNIATIYAYGADITEPKDRTHFFGLLGAAAGMGFVMGPALGGLLYKLTNSFEAPLYFAAALTLANTVWGFFAMPESLTHDKRDQSITVARLNPLVQLGNAFRLPELRLLLLGVFIWTFAFAMLQSNVSFLTEDRLHWTPDGTSAIFFTVGSITILVQGLLIRRLLPRFGEARLAIAGLLAIGIGFIIIAVVTATSYAPLLFVAVIFTATGNGLITPSLAGLLSQAVTMREQGRVQGGNQSVQALGRVIGPLWGGWTYGSIGPAAPYITGAVILGVAALTVTAAVPTLARHKEQRSAEANPVRAFEPGGSVEPDPTAWRE